MSDNTDLEAAATTAAAAALVDANTSFGIGEDESATTTPPPPPPPRPASNTLPDSTEAISTPKPSTTTTKTTTSTSKGTSAPPSTASNTELETAKRLLRTSKNKIEELKAQLQREKDEVAKIKHEFQRFTIRSELDRQQRETEILKLTETNLKYQQFNVISHDLQSEVEVLRKKFEALERERVELVGETHRLSQLLAQEQRAKMDAMQREAEVRRQLDSVVPDALARARVDVGEELAEVKREFKLFRDLTEKRLEEKDQEIQNAKTSSEASTELAYLRDVVLKYLASKNDEQSLHAMEAAIASVLRFNNEEVDFVREKRRSDAGWALAFKSSIGF